MKPNPSTAQAAAVMTAAALTMAEAVPATQSVTLSADDAFEQGMGSVNVQRDATTGGIGLYDRNLIEDDGPGGGDHQPGKNAAPPPLKIGGTKRIKKILHIDRPEATAAHLYLREDALVEINGRRFDMPARTFQEPYAAVPVSLLKQGDNEIILSSSGEEAVGVACSAREHILRNDPGRRGNPPRSFTSDDDGKTWHPFDGEFRIRLHLVQHAAEGHFVSPVIDLARGEAEQFGSRAAVQSARLIAETKTPAGTEIRFMARSGSTPVFDAAAWGDWQTVAKVGVIRRPDRYLQWKAVLRTANPTVTPVVRKVDVESTFMRAKQPEWARRVEVLACENPTISYTLVPFAYEDPQHPKLVALRKKYRLDAVVAGATSELDKFVRLRNWIAQQWKWTPPVVDYPDWDADEILTRKYGFCVQFAIAYMQCAIALGYQTRFVFANNPGNGGHEVCEVWSNDYQKWIYMDPADNFHYVDRKTNIPLSLMETHDLIFKTYLGDRQLTYATLPNDKKLVPELGICYALELEPTGSSPSWSREQAIDGIYPLTRQWTMLRYVPRNNFASQPYPAPIAQMRYWEYADYILWEGPQMPKGQWHFRNFTARRSDIEWTLNQVRFEAIFEEKPGAVDIQMGTVTPGFETFLVRTDGGAWRPEKSGFTWQLHARTNRLEMRVRTRAGIEGPVSRLELDYAN